MNKKETYNQKKIIIPSICNISLCNPMPKTEFLHKNDVNSEVRSFMGGVDDERQ